LVTVLKQPVQPHHFCKSTARHRKIYSMKSAQILHIEDSADDTEFVQHTLQKGGVDCTIRRVETRAELVRELEQSPWDLILSDCALPEFDGFEALEIVRKLKPLLPFIFVSGTIGEETAIKSLQEGATDYVLKDRMARLVPAIQRALAEAEERTMLRSMRMRLHHARRFEAVGRLAGGLAPDFNNLFQMIKTQVALLPRESADSAQIAKISEKLNQAADRGAERIKELLVFARKADAHFTSVNVVKLIDEVVEAHRSCLPVNTTIDIRADKDLPPIFADPSQVDRMMSNLIMNARDAMPEGGHISLSAGIIRFDPSLPQGCHLDDDPLYLCLRVSDTGMGMDEPTRLHAFEPFFTTKTLESGTGLGLSVVFGLIQIHNGLIDIVSRQGEGTTVSLFFPLPQSSKVIAEKIEKIPPFQLLEGIGGGE
jgi:two-component system, cell cycle sensor histidine kinase and response regulator CckA